MSRLSLIAKQTAERTHVFSTEVHGKRGGVPRLKAFVLKTRPGRKVDLRRKSAPSSDRAAGDDETATATDPPMNK